MTPAAFGDFAAFYTDAAPKLWRYLVRLGASRTAAEDIVQDAFVRWSLSPAAGWEAARARGYLFRIATRLLIDGWRRTRREMPSDDVPDNIATADPAPGTIFDGGAWRALTRRQQQLLWLAYVEEFSHAEIAAITGLAAGGIRVLLSRARAALTAHLQSAETDDER